MQEWIAIKQENTPLNERSGNSVYCNMELLRKQQ
jgi:hypothetical protein